MDQELQARLKAVQQELRQIQNEMEEDSLPYLSVDMAVSAVVMAWHLNRNERGLARHNMGTLIYIVETADILLNPKPTE